MSPVETFSGTGNVHSADICKPTGYAARPKIPNKKQHNTTMGCKPTWSVN